MGIGQKLSRSGDRTKCSVANHGGISELLLLNADMIEEIVLAVSHHYDKHDNGYDLACL